MSKAQIFNAPAAPPLAQTLAGQTALITGASSGIGRAIAVELAARGASLCLLGRRPAVLQDIALRLAPDACKWVYRTDLVDSEEIEKLRGSLARDGAEPTILVHSAGVIALGPLEQASLADFDRQLNVNVRAPYALTQALLGGL
jgi:short-subunit dehydrogenase